MLLVGRTTNSLAKKSSQDAHAKEDALDAHKKNLETYI
jgi:hypothetical protein